VKFIGLLGIILAGCGNQTEINRVKGQIEVTPGLSDVGDVVVGSENAFAATITWTAGQEVQVDTVTVSNVDGTFFALAAPWEQATVDQENPNALINFVYTPTEAGYHRATVAIVSSSRTPQTSIEMRGRAVLGSASVRPRLLDFGALGAGESRSLSLVVENDGGADLQIQGGTFSDPGFSISAATPISLPIGAEIEVPIMYQAPDASTVNGTLDFDLGGYVTTTQVALRANDCAHGTPSAYDVDQDGYTSCGGDCDDDDPSSHPGGVETYDGHDQDCDGIVDEGTEGYDDDGDGETELQGDCNDGLAAVNTGETEVCDGVNNTNCSNGIDDNCDGLVDFGTTDADADGYSEVGGDCDDLDETVYPFAPEAVDTDGDGDTEADGVDNDCDGIVDEGTTAYDDDLDGVDEAAGDCNDSDATIYPGATEAANWKDDDCDGTVDEGTTNYDDDGDGFSELGNDCDDADSAVNPGEPEVTGNAVDEDCDGTAQ
jgi:hypothetical protein